MSPVALDCETHLISGGNAAPQPVAFGVNATPPGMDDWCLDASGVSLVHARSNHLNDLFDWAVHDCTITTQNGAFDLAVICRCRPDLISAVFDAYDQNRVYDLATRQKLRDIATGEHRGRFHNGKWEKFDYNLGSMAARHGYPHKLVKDDWRLRYSELDDVRPRDWPDGARDYLVHDVASTAWVHEGQSQYEERFLADQFRQARYAWALELVAVHGLITERRMVDRYMAMAQEELAADRDMLAEMGFVFLNKSGKRAGKWSRREKRFKTEYLAPMWERLEVRKPPRTPTGDFQMGEDAALMSGDPVFLAFQRFGSATTLIARVEELYAGCDGGAIHTHFDPLLATGRTSSSAPNVQNRRRKPGDRECFVPRPGCVFVDCDYDGLELRTISQGMIWLGFGSRMGERLNAGADLHLEVASAIMSAPYDDLLLVRGGKVEFCPDDPADSGVAGLQRTTNEVMLSSCGMGSGPPNRLYKTWAEGHLNYVRYPTTLAELMAWFAYWTDESRQTGKIANFGFNAGSGVPKFLNEARAKYGIHMTRREAEWLRATWLATWPEFDAFFKWVSSTTRMSGDYATFVHFLSDRVRAGLSYTELANTPSQGLGADATKEAGYELARACYVPGVNSILYGCRVANYIHDQFLVEVPDDRWAHDRAMEVARVMTETANRWLPDVPATASPMLCRRWSKMAKAVRGPDGRLVPWEWEGAL